MRSDYSVNVCCLGFRSLHGAHLETTAVRALGDGWRRGANDSDDAGFFQRVGVRFGTSSSFKLQTHPTNLIRQVFDEPSRVSGKVRSVIMIRSGLVAEPRSNAESLDLMNRSLDVIRCLL
jgi:hypothetical protein